MRKLSICADIFPSMLSTCDFTISCKWSISHSVCSHRSCCRNSHCAHVPQQSWACKIIVHNNVIIEVYITGSLLRKFATIDAPRPCPMFSYSCRIESLPAYRPNWIQHPNGVAITHNLNPTFMGLLCV